VWCVAVAAEKYDPEADDEDDRTGHQVNYDTYPSNMMQYVRQVDFR